MSGTSRPNVIQAARIYLRVSTEQQDLARQEAIVAGARASGFYVAAVYREKASGARPDRPELLRMVADLQPGEVVVAEKIDRISRLPLPEAITLNYAQPLLVVAFSALFLHETIRAYRWTAVAVGLAGVLVISWPNLTLLASPAGIDNQELLGVIAVLASAAISAGAMILVRSLVHTERTATIVLWFSLTATVASLFSLPFGWQWLTPTQCALLVGAGVCGGLGQILMTQAYRHAEASVVAPFEYTSMILGVAVGYWAFSEVPTANTLVGGVIVVAAGIFIIWREHRLGLPRGAARKLVPPQG